MASRASGRIAGAGMAAALVALVLVTGCSKSGGSGGGAARRGVGQAVSPGHVSDVRLTPDGQTAVFLVDGQKPRLDGIPPMMLLGRLRAVRVDGSADRELGGGVTNVPGGFVLSRDSAWVAFLASYQPANQTGTLMVADLRDPKGTPVRVADGVSYAVLSPNSKWLAYVAGGVLRAGPTGEGPYAEVAGEVALADFAPSSAFLVARRKGAAGGALLKVDVGQWQSPKKLADQVGDFAVSPDSARIALGARSPRVPAAYDLHVASAPQFTPAKVADSVGAFAFSADSQYLARIQGQPPGPDQVGDLYVGPADGSGGHLVAARAHEFTFAPDSRGIGYIAAYRTQSQAGTLGVAPLPEGKPRDLGDLVPNFVWSGDGKAVAYLERFLRPIFSVDLMLYRLGDPAPVKVQQGVYGYAFTPDGKRLLYRTACIRDGRACDLFSRDLDAPYRTDDAGMLESRGKKMAEGVYGYFKAAEKAPRALVTFARIDSPLYDVGVVNLETGQYKTLEERVLLTPAFANGEGTRVVYAVAERAHPGVYVADKVP
ncbi:MAG TPA: gliding motility protein [Myxococcales bacterium]|nr:gliding motility protein [Myxococcales bacterium]